MIWNILVIVVLIIAFFVIARRLPDARKKMIHDNTISAKEMNVHGIIAQADDAFSRHRYDQAESLYVKAAVSDPDNPKIFSKLGAIYLEQKNFYDAKEAFLHAAKIEPNIAPRHVNLGLAYMGLKDYYKAAEVFKHAVDLDPKNKKYRKLLEKSEKLRDSDRPKKIKK